jgi:hypothetical protein
VLVVAAGAAAGAVGCAGTHPAPAQRPAATPTETAASSAWRARTVRLLEARLATEGPYPAFLVPQPAVSPLRVADAVVALGPAYARSPAAVAMLRGLWRPRTRLFELPRSSASDLYATALVLRALAAEHVRVPEAQARQIVGAVARRAVAKDAAAALAGLRVVQALAGDAEWRPRTRTGVAPADALVRSLAVLRGRLRPPAPCRSAGTLAAAAAAFERARLAGAGCPPATVARVRPLGAKALRRLASRLHRGAVLDVGAADQLVALAELARAGAAPRVRVRRLVAAVLAAQASPTAPPALEPAGSETTLRLVLDAARATGAARSAPARARALLARTVRWLGRLPQVQTGDAFNTVAGLHALAALGARATARRLARDVRLGAVEDPSERLILAAGLAPQRVTPRLLETVARDGAIDEDTRQLDLAIALVAHPALCDAPAVRRLVAAVAPDPARLPALVATASGAELVRLASLAGLPARCGAGDGAAARSAVARRLRELELPGGVAARRPGEAADLIASWNAVEAACLVGERRASAGAGVRALLASVLDGAGGTRLGAGPGGATIATYAAVRVAGAARDGCGDAFFRPLDAGA